MKRITVAALALGLLAGCGYEATPVPEPETAPSSSAGSGGSETEPCEEQTSDLASYEPSDDVAGGKVEEILDRGRLIVGVSGDTRLMASENPETTRIEGFDIEIVKAIGEAIWGDDFRIGEHIQFRVITAADRVPLLESGEVDLVVRNMTINCTRWQQIAFSQVYYGAAQKVLVRSDLADGIVANGEYDSAADLGGLRVCAPRGSTSLENVVQAAEDAEATEDPIIEPADTHTGCLVRFQQGEVDAITGDDTVLAGLAAQDPYAVVPEDQPQLADEPYGVGANREDVDLVRFVNQVLEDMRADGSWQRAYQRWLEPYLGVPAQQPQPVLPYRSPGE